MGQQVRRFEDLIAWQKARILAAKIYQVTGESPFSRDFGLRNQIQRASVSVMSNIAEGHERCTPAEFRYFLRIAKGSCAELRSQLYVALDVGYLMTEAFEQLCSLADEVARLIGGLIVSVARRIEQS